MWVGTYICKCMQAQLLLLSVICMYVCIYVYTSTYIQNMCAFMYVLKGRCIQMYVCIYVSVCLYVCMLTLITMRTVLTVW